MSSFRTSFAACILALAAPTALAHAQAATPAPAPQVEPPPTPAETAAVAGDAPDEEMGRSELARSGVLGDEQTLYEERYGYGELPDRTSPHEVADHAYWSFGFGYRHSFAPRGLIELFSKRAPSGIQIPQFQFELDRRLNGVDLIFALSYGDYSFYGPFQGNGDPVSETEIIDSSLRSVGASVSMLWSSDFNDVVALQYGFDLGLGVLFGDLVRTEAYPSTGGPHTHDGWSPCVGPTSAGSPGSAQATDPFDAARFPSSGLDSFCGTPSDTSPAGGFTDPDSNNGEQYGVRARGLFNGGKVPPFSWRAAPRLSLRIKPIRQLIIRIDTGFDFGSGIFAGGSLYYGF